MSNQHAGSKSSDGDIGYFILFTIAVLMAGYFWILYGQIVSLVLFAIGFFVFLLTTILAILPIKKAHDRDPGLYDSEVIQYIGIRLVWLLLLSSLILAYSSTQPSDTGDPFILTNAAFKFGAIIFVGFFIIYLAFLEYLLTRYLIKTLNGEPPTNLEFTAYIYRPLLFIVTILFAILTIFVASGKIEFVSPDMFDSLFQGLF